MHEQLIVLLGHPVTHSKSPEMHNAAFRSMKLPFQYMAFNVKPERLGEAIAGFRALGFQGANVTVPHKVSIIPFLDEMTPLASEIGSVNTLFYQNDRLVGDNTDGQGYMTSLLQEFPYIDLMQMKVGIVGAGGAARAIAFTLAHYGVKKLYITNRHVEKGRQLVDELTRMTNTNTACMAFDQFHHITSQLDLLIQATSVGMYPNVGECLVPIHWLHRHMIVSDLVYNPIETRLLKDAKAIGASIHTGIGMLVYQGALSFERWTREVAPVEVMKEVLLKSLFD